MPKIDTSAERAMDVFTQGYALLRSRTHPYLVDRLGPLWYFHDAPRKDPRKERSRELVALADMKPDEVVSTIRKAKVGRHSLCVYHESHSRDPQIESDYKALGYRCKSHEAVFVYPFPPAPRARNPYRVQRVTDLETVRLIAKAARSRQIDEKDVGDDSAPRRLFAVIDEDRVQGYCSSLRVDEAAAWVANVYVNPDDRRQGIGKALMQHMLKDDHSRGIRQSFLTASINGVWLYRSVGYQQLGVLQVFHSGKPA